MPTPNAPLEAPAPALVERFRGDLLRLKRCNVPERFGLAVSGGPDSVAMLLLAHAAFPTRIEVATVDHRLRVGSAAEAVFTADLCATLDIACEILTVDVTDNGNLSANARKARYAALDEWCLRRRLAWLLTAHHADDQLETFIMRANRGSGVAGLTGIRRVQGNVLRPLLRWRRSELAAVVVDSGIVPVSDPSNADDRFDRARLRKDLSSVDWLDAVAVSDAAAMLGRADAALIWIADQMAADLIMFEKGDVVLDRHFADFPAELVRRFVIHAMLHVDPEFAVTSGGGGGLGRFVERLEDGKSATLGTIHATVREGRWHFRLAPARRTIAAT